MTGFAGLVRRRNVLLGTASLLALAEIGATGAQAREIAGKLPGVSPGSPPQPIAPGDCQFFTPEEGSAVEAIVDRLIPPDADFAGGKDAGCAVYIDRQLADPFGSDQGLYVQARSFTARSSRDCRPARRRPRSIGPACARSRRIAARPTWARFSATCPRRSRTGCSAA